MVWGCFSFGGVRKIVKIDTKMTSLITSTLLEKTQLFRHQKYRCTNTFSSKIMIRSILAKWQSSFYSQNNVELLEWPPQSQDLNPIEHLWSILDKRIPLDGRRNIRSFWESLQFECERIPFEILVESGSQRTKATCSCYSK